MTESIDYAATLILKVIVSADAMGTSSNDEWVATLSVNDDFVDHIRRVKLADTGALVGYQLRGGDVFSTIQAVVDDFAKNQVRLDVKYPR